MKYVILAIAALGMFSCTSSTNVAQNKSKQRTIASLQAMGLSDAEANELTLEVSRYQAPAGKPTITFEEKVAQYKGLLNTFSQTAASKKFTTKQKVEMMKEDVTNAKKRISNFTGGSGITHSLLMNRVNTVSEHLNNNDPAAAADSAKTSSTWAIQLAEAMK